MKDILFRPKLLSEVEMCEICGRGVGMVFDNRKIQNPHPFMCWVCKLRFPPKQWETDKEGLFFNLSKNGSVEFKDRNITPSLENKYEVDFK